MSFKYPAILLAGLLSAPGCSQAPPRSVDVILNTPSNRQEAVALMQTVALEATTNTLDPNAAQRFRLRMTGRLTSAGLSTNEISEWVARGVFPADPGDDGEGAQ